MRTLHHSTILTCRTTVKPMGGLKIDVNIDLDYQSRSEVALDGLEVCVVAELLPTVREYNATCDKVGQITVRPYPLLDHCI